jgi:hypothetical protein
MSAPEASVMAISSSEVLIRPNIDRKERNISIG